MANGGDLELQAAINARLAADPNVQALLGTPPRIYQDVPANGVPVFPYALLGESSEIDNSAPQCGLASDISTDIHVWSRQPGFEEVKRIAWAIRVSLHNADLALATQRCVLIEHSVTRHLRDGEIPVKHAILTFHANVEESA